MKLEKKLRRKQAALVIAQVAAVAVRTDAKDVLSLLKAWGVEARACTGAAHSNAFMDNCPMCSPHWGVVVSKVVS